MVPKGGCSEKDTIQGQFSVGLFSTSKGTNGFCVLTRVEQVTTFSRMSALAEEAWQSLSKAVSSEPTCGFFYDHL